MVTSSAFFTPSSMHTFHSPVSGSGFYENRFLYRNNAERVEAFKGTLEKQGIDLKDPHVQGVLDDYTNLMRQIANNPLRKNRREEHDGTIRALQPACDAHHSRLSQPPSEEHATGFPHRLVSPLAVALASHAALLAKVVNNDGKVTTK